MNLRKAIFWLHLFCGVVAGILVLIMSVTGVALTYQKQMTSWADKRMYEMDVPANASPVSAELLLTNLRKGRPEITPANITYSSDPRMPAQITAGPNTVILANPYTGQILGEGAKGTREFFRVMTDWHRWLSLSGKNRSMGRMLTGAANLVFLFIALSGVYLWWPRRWSTAALRALTWFRFRAGGRTRDLNWHNVFGFWCVIPLILIIASGVVISYPWASNLVFRLAGTDAPPQMGPGGRRGNFGPPSRRPVQIEGIDALLNSVRGQAENWKTISFSPPAVADKAVSFSVDSGYGGQPQRRTTLVVDKDTAKVLRKETFQQMNAGLRTRIWLRFVHTGEYYGLAGQTIAGIASIAGVVLVWTGLALTYRRYIAWTRRRLQN